MKFRSSKAGAALLFAAGCLAAMSVHALEFKSIEVPVAVLFDAPSTKGKKLFLLKRFTPLEVIVSVEGFTKVREPEGAIGWIEKKSLSDKRQLVVTVPKASVRAAPLDTAPQVFEAEKGVALELLEPAKEGWARVRHLDGATGVLRVNQVWGL